ncbi:hypothetical protein LW858_29725 (plasmid) [Bacillus cereus]|uniref:hypothetical protein n=1 Tax=Bacillus cereus TaxID=1396 RepID=UPI001F364D0D|nr:hypothetical protein [Bacillus cereus]UIJ69729.1 hypothetical protein LW858_29725 [Bacillus cereus]
MDCYSKIILSNGKEYMVPLRFNELIGKKLVNGERELFNTWILVPHIDVETGKELQVALNSLYIVIIEEFNVKMQPNIPLIFRSEKINQD